MKRFKNTLIIKTAMIAASLFVSSASHANEDQAIAKILQSGQQTILSQQIAKASCYIGTFNQVNEHLSIMERAQKQFEQNHHSLQRIKSDVGDLPEQNPVIILVLQETLDNWKLVQFSAELSGDMPQNPGLDIDLMARFNEGLSRSTQSLSKAVMEVYTNQTPSFNTLNLMPHLGFLIQKASKEFCYISYGLKVESNKTKLLQTMNSIDQVLSDLINGNLEKDILAAPNEDIKGKLLRVQSQWLVIRRIMYKTASGTMPQSNDFKIISDISDPMTQESLDIARLFVNAYRAHQQEQAN